MTAITYKNNNDNNDNNYEKNRKMTPSDPWSSLNRSEIKIL